MYTRFQWFQHCKASPKVPVLPTNPAGPLPTSPRPEAAVHGATAVSKTHDYMYSCTRRIRIQFSDKSILGFRQFWDSASDSTNLVPKTNTVEKWCARSLCCSRLPPQPTVRFHREA